MYFTQRVNADRFESTQGIITVLVNDERLDIYPRNTNTPFLSGVVVQDYEICMRLKRM